TRTMELSAAFSLRTHYTDKDGRKNLRRRIAIPPSTKLLGILAEDVMKKNTKVCLIHPKATVPPYGLLSMAAVLEKQGFIVKIINYNNKKITREGVLKDTRGFDIVGISVITAQGIGTACKITEIIQKYGKSFLVWGGVHPTLYPEKVLNELNIDAVCSKEGEATILDLANHIEEKAPIEEVKGLYIKSKGKIKFTGEREVIRHINKLPDYAWHLINVKEYIIRRLNGKKSITLIESRGCPYNCAFCYVPTMFGRCWRGRSVDQVIGDVNYLRNKYNITYFDFLDDLPFGGDKEQVFDFCNKMKKLKVNWSIAYRVNLADWDVLKKMRWAGCNRIFFGVESGSPRMLKLLNKTYVTPEIAEKSINRCHKLGISTQAGFMGGLPKERKEDLMMTYNLAKKLKATLVRLRNYKPYPGSACYDLVIKSGFKPPEKIEEWEKFSSIHDFNLNFSDGVPIQDYIKVQKALERISIWKSFLFSIKHGDMTDFIVAVSNSMPTRIREWALNIYLKIQKKI
ncbi:MAG: B12-binding domain-containing radical SAM protein, partial [Nanoarchaeota archaeon]|nr:B12-binding domain-containing radical SAM protein [Nanoarchaeota archaeon]